MSEDQKPVSEPAGDQKQSLDSNPEAEKYVPRKAYEEVSSDMHKYKSSLKDAKAEAEALKAQLKAREEAELVEQKKFQELFERERQEKENLLEETRRNKDMYIRSVKLSQLKAELGNVKDEYLQFADIDGITMDDNGSLSPDSIREVANKFRQEHPGLLPASQNMNITSKAPANGGVQELSYEEALAKVKTQQELDALRAKYGRS